MRTACTPGERVDAQGNQRRPARGHARLRCGLSVALWVVTGADRGIGAALCRLLTQRGDVPLAACLDDAPDLRMQGIEVVGGVDVTCAQGVARLQAQLGTRGVDVLVHNAGLVIEQSFGAFDYAALQREYAVNTLACCA